MTTVGAIDAQLRLQYSEFINGLRAAGAAASDFGRAAGSAFGSVADYARSTAQSVTRDFARLREALAQMQQGLQATGRAMAAFGAASTSALGVASKEFMDFEQNMRNVTAVAGDAEKTFGQLSDALLDMPSKEQITSGPRDLSKALYDIRSSGFDAKDGLEVLRVAANAADAGLSNTKTSATGLLALMKAYRVDASGAQQVGDMMLQTVRNAKVTYEQLANNIGRVAAGASTARVSMAEMLGMFATLTPVLGAEHSVEALNMAVTKLAAQGPQAKKVLDQLFAGTGIQINEETLAKKGGIWAIEQVYKRTGGSLDLLKRIFEDENAVRAAAIIGADPGTARKYTQANVQSSGAIDQQKAEQSKAIMTQLKRAWAELESISIRAGALLAPYLSIAVDWLQKLEKVWVSLSPSLQRGAVIFTALSGAAAVVGGAFVLLAPQIGAVVAMFTSGALATAIGAATSILGSLALPILGVTAGVAALYYAWRENWGGIQETTYSVANTVWTYLVDGFNYLRVEVPRIWNETYNLLRFAVNRFWSEVKPAFQEGVSFVAEAWDSIVPIVKLWWAVYIPALKAEFQLLWEVVKVSMEAISASWSIAWEIIKGVVATVWPMIRANVLAFLDIVKGLMQAFGQALNGDWQGAWDSVVTALSNAGTHVVQGVNHMLDNALQAMKNVAGQWALAAENLMASFAQGIRNGGSIVSQAFSDMVAGTAVAAQDVGPAALPPPPWMLRDSSMAVSGGASWGDPAPKKPLGPPPAPSLVKPNIDIEHIKKTPPKKMLQILIDVEQVSDPNAKVVDGFASPRGVSAYRDRPGQHNGYDIAMRPGSNVGAAWPGVVKNIFPLGPPGEYGVIVDSGAFSAQYNHIRPGVTKGATVKAGDPIGQTIIDHLDVKLRDAAGSFFDPAKVTDKSGSKGAAMEEQIGKAFRDFMQLRPDGTTSETATKRQDIEQKYAQASLNVKPGSPEEATLIAQRDRLLEHLGALDIRHAEDLQTQLARISADADNVQIAGQARVELERLAITERYRKDFRAVEDAEAKPDVTADQKAAIEKARGQLRIAQAREEAGVMIGIVEELNTARYKATVEEQRVNDQMFAERVRQIEEERKFGRISADEALAQYGQQLNVYQSGSQARIDAELTYQEKFKEILGQKQQILGDDFLAYLEKLKVQLLAVDQTILTNQLQLQAVEQVLQTQRVARLNEERAKIQQAASSINQSFTNFLDQMATGQQSFNKSFQALWQSIVQVVIQYVTQMIVKVLALQAIMKGAFGWLTGGLGLFGGGVSTSFTSFVPIAHTGGLVIPGGIQSFHTGGMVGGLRSDEVLAKLQVGEMVLSRAQVEEASRSASRRSEQPVVYAPQTTIETVFIREEADIDRLVTAIAQKQRDDWQAWI